ncbi:MAG: UMP kinase [Euryarchaeota archaeon]|nr:UMP kinase [Euryarchaeota archaeon]|tara:strand:+ start:3992 stop:4696 length:705 start_codon:yes stop_codon:yes gene_type:complete
MKNVVVAVGGSLLRPEIEQRSSWLEDLAELVKEQISSGIRLGIVVGGGSPARESIQLVKTIINDVLALDRIGISATRLNASIIKEVFQNSGINVSEKIPDDIAQAVIMMEKYDVVVMGGTLPGHTTDKVAIELAISTNSEKCIIATNVKKVYDKDPRKYRNAKSFDEMSIDELQEIVGPAKHVKAGASQVVDPIGVSLAVESNLTLNILDGRKVKNIKDAIQGNMFEGTIVKGD